MSPGAAGQSEGTLMETWGELCQQIAWVTVTKQEGLMGQLQKRCCSVRETGGLTPKGTRLRPCVFY